MCLWLCPTLCGAAQLADEAAGPPAPALTATAKDEGPRLKGSIGFGFDSVRGASTGTGLVPGVAQSNALALRYWINDTLSWDGLVAVNYSSTPSNSQGGAGVAAGTDQRAWGVGTQFKVNMARPSTWLLGQLLARASLAQFTQSSNTTANSSQTTNTLSLGMGLGFEAFIPVWKALSLEGSVGLNLSSTQVKVEGSSTVQSGSTLSIDANGLTPVNVAVHYYF